MTSPSSERYLGGFYVERDEPFDAIYRSRPARYAIVLDSYADAVAWRRVVRDGGSPLAQSETFIVPLSQAAGTAASEIRETVAQADEEEARAAELAEATAGAPAPMPPEPMPAEPAPSGAYLEEALDHLRVVLHRKPHYTHYDEFFVATERCAYCEADLAGARHGSDKHTPDCSWQAARRFLLERALGL